MRYAVLTMLLLLCAGCCADREFERCFGADAPRGKIIAVRTSETVKIDGILSEKDWEKAPVYDMREAYRRFEVDTPKERKNRAMFPADPGVVRVMYDDKFLYVSARLADCDVVQYNDNDQDLLYRTGDLFEIFVKSENSPRYLECYIAPNGKRTTLEHVTRGYPRKDWGKLNKAYIAAAAVQGTLNDYSDSDRLWTAEAAIPFSLIKEVTGEDFPGKGGWTVFFGRYDYCYGFGYFKSTGVPQLPLPNFHLTEYYAELVLK